MITGPLCTVNKVAVNFVQVRWFSLVIIDCEPIAVLVGVGIPYVWKGDHKFVECNVFLFRGLSVVTILCSP